VSTRPRVLWITAEVPDRALGGGNIVQANLLDALVAHADVDLAVAGHLRDDVLRDRLASVTEVPAPSPRAPTSVWERRVRDLFNALVRRAPEDVRGSAGARRDLARALGTRAAAADVVVVMHLGLAPLLQSARANRWVLHLLDLASQRAEDAAALAPGGRQRWLLEREQAKAARVERWAASAYDLVVVPSALDAARLGGAPTVVPNGVDVDRFAPTPVPREPRLLLSGTFSYWPNIDGAEWFCDEVLPVVRAAVPDVTLELVGRQPVASIQGLAARPGVSLHRDVPDVLPHLAGARVAVVPVRIGSGTRVKALEALAAGRPVVGTAIGLAGLGLRDGVDAAVADDPAAMAAAIVDLLQDDALASARAAAGRQVVEQRFAWPVVARVYLDQVLAARS
jgi:glycosyltransferase involved in cell wall biosynthesis